MGMLQTLHETDMDHCNPFARTGGEQQRDSHRGGIGMCTGRGPNAETSLKGPYKAPSPFWLRMQLSVLVPR